MTAGFNTVVPAMPFCLVGGVIEICSNCYSQWEAAMSTWFELATNRNEEDSAMGAVHSTEKGVAVLSARAVLEMLAGIVSL